MPRSVLLGRAVQPGEPLFTDEDTAYALALAEEERDTCPSCGYPKAWCRTKDAQRGVAMFEVAEERCWATYRLELRREAMASEGAHAATKAAMQMSARFREGYQPELDAGLELPEGADQRDDEADQDKQKQ